MTETNWQAFRLAFQALGQRLKTACSSWNQRDAGITGTRERNSHMNDHNQSADDPGPL